MSKLTTTSAVRALRKAAKSAGVQVGRIAVSDRTEVGLIDNTTRMWSGRVQLHWCKGSVELMQRYLENTNLVLNARPCGDGHFSVSVNVA
ncbi:hypothetical protein [Vibrio phage vB_VpS_BA3]|nr:hypothetical protein [Vibrio phage vB_VpS_BA3]